jgi:hypothetical protein
MGYYQGDFYAGYRGDPGFFSFLGGIAKKAVGFIPGVGPAISTALSAIPKFGGGARTASAIQVAKSLPGRAGAMISKHPVLTAAGAAGVIGGSAAAVRGRGPRMSGTPATLAMHGAMGMRRRHRMNVCNPKALRRAIRRTHGFAKLAMRTIHLVHPKKHATFGGFKVKRRRK